MGNLYLIPADLGGEDLTWVLPQAHAATINRISHFAVENLREGRRFLKRAGIQAAIDDLHFYQVNKDATSVELAPAIAALKSGQDVGMLSDAGVPCVADPGALLVAAAHSNRIPVVPMVGPSSILLALMASGMNGQDFAFRGYVPRDSSERSKWLKQLMQHVRKTQQTQLFMDTPYRNDALIEATVKELIDPLWFGVAADLTLATEFIQCGPKSIWKRKAPSLHKRPAIMMVGYQLGQAT